MTDKLTRWQEDEICYVIGDWYLKWKYRMCDFKNETHNLGFAKEDLKEMIINKLGVSAEQNE